MLPMLVAALGFWLMAIFDGSAGTYRTVGQTYRDMVKENQVQEMASAVGEFHRETGAYPADLNALVTTAGKEHLRSSMDAWQGYARSGTLNDGVWRYTRTALFMRNPTDGLSSTDYLAINTCGTGAATTASSWCGQMSSKWYREESRQDFNRQISQQRARMSMLLQKLASHYNAVQALPDRNFSGGALGASSITRVSALVNYLGAANNCTGTFVYMNSVPIECQDMFDIWGGPIGYQFVSNKRVILVSESPLVNAGGQAVRVAAELDLTGL